MLTPFFIKLLPTIFTSCSVSRTWLHAMSPATDLLTQILLSLNYTYWFPVSKRINFKIATLTYEILRSEQPAYLRSLIRFEVAIRLLRSTSQHKLHQPRIHRTIGERAFSSASPTIWNNIPLSIRTASSLSDFKRHLNQSINQERQKRDVSPMDFKVAV